MSLVQSNCRRRPLGSRGARRPRDGGDAASYRQQTVRPSRTSTHSIMHGAFACRNQASQATLGIKEQLEERRRICQRSEVRSSYQSTCQKAIARTTREAQREACTVHRSPSVREAGMDRGGRRFFQHCADVRSVFCQQCLSQTVLTHRNPRSRGTRRTAFEGSSCPCPKGHKRRLLSS